MKEKKPTKKEAEYLATLKTRLESANQELNELLKRYKFKIVVTRYNFDNGDVFVPQLAPEEQPTTMLNIQMGQTQEPQSKLSGGHE